jgi:hypothetical protein
MWGHNSPTLRRKNLSEIPRVAERVRYRFCDTWTVGGDRDTSATPANPPGVLVSAPPYPEFRDRFNGGLDVDTLIATFWHRDGPHTPDTVASAALGIDELTHYLARATFGPSVLPHGSDVYVLVRELRSALGRLDQVLDQVSARTAALATDPTLYDDRHDGRDPAATVRELHGGLDGARVALGPLLAALGAAHNAAGHLGHTTTEPDA